MAPGHLSLRLIVAQWAVAVKLSRDEVSVKCKLFFRQIWRIQKTFIISFKVKMISYYAFDFASNLIATERKN